jgi:hypothetical protein
MLTQILKTLHAEKPRTLLTVSGIAVGVAAIVALRDERRITPVRFGVFRQWSRPGDDTKGSFASP